MTIPHVLNPYLSVTQAQIFDAIGHPGVIADSDKLPPLDIPLLEKGRAWVNEQAQLPAGESEWDQENWTDETACGTSFCFAGYIGYQLAGSALDVKTQFVTLNDGSRVHVSDFAQYWLGLDPYAEDNLFDGSNELHDINRVVDRLVNES